MLRGYGSSPRRKSREFLPDLGLERMGADAVRFMRVWMPVLQVFRLEHVPEGNALHVIVTGEEKRMGIVGVGSEIVALAHGQIGNGLAGRAAEVLLPPRLFEAHEQLESRLHDHGCNVPMALQLRFR